MSGAATTRPRSSVLAACFVLASACGGGPLGSVSPPSDVASGGARDVSADVAVAPAPDAPPPVDAGSAPALRVQPRLRVDAPLHGLWAPGAVAVTVEGQVVAGTSALSSLTLAGADIPFDADGRFSMEIPAQPGVNLVGLRVEDEDGGRAVDGRAFFHGEHHPPGTLLPGAAYAFLRADFLDDDEDDLDDVARLVEVLLADPAFLAALNVPVATEWVTVTPTAVTHEGAHVDLRPRAPEQPEDPEDPGILGLVAVLQQPVLAFTAETAEGDDTLSGDGRITATAARMQVDLALSVDAGAVQADVRFVEVALEGFAMQTDLVPDWLVESPAAADLVRSFLEDTIEEQVVDYVGALLQELLGALAFDLRLGEDFPVDFALRLEDLSVARDGLRLVLGASVTSPPAAGIHNGEVAGSFRTDSAPPPADFGAAPVAFAVDDDLLNQLLFAFWHGGALSDVTFDETDLGELGAGDLPQVFLPLRRVLIDATLPLVLTKRTVEDDFSFDLALGDMQVVVETQDDRTFGLFLSLRAGVRAFVADGDVLKLQADRRPPLVEVQAGCYAAPPAIDPASIAALIRLMVPPILATSNEGLPGFPVPAIPLSALLDVASFADKEMVFEDIALGTLGPRGDFLLLEGRPLVRTTRDARAVSPAP